MPLSSSGAASRAPPSSSSSQPSHATATAAPPVRAHVEATRTVTGSGRAHTVYVVVVQCDTADRSWMVNRRFNEFATLHAHLAKKFSTLPPMPAKTWFFTMDAEFVEQRRQALDRYIAAIVTMRPVLLCPELNEFLELDAHGVGVSDPATPVAFTVLTDPKFGVNDIAFDDADGVVISANEDTHLLSRFDSYISNVRLPWEDKGAVVPVGSMNVWKRDENSEWRVSACEYFECQATCIGYDAERRYIFVGLHTGCINAYRANNAFSEVHLTAQIPLHRLRVSKLIYSADKDVLISCGRDGQLALYDVGGSKMITTKDLGQGKLMSLELDREDDRVLVGTDTNKIVLVDMSGNLFRVCTILSGHTGPVRALHLAGEDMNLFSGGDRVAIVWVINKRNQAESRCRPVGAFKGGPSGVLRSVAYSSTFKELLTGSSNGMLAVWDVSNGGIKVVLAAHTAELTFLRWLSPTTFVSASRDGSIKFWQRPRREAAVQRSGNGGGSDVAPHHNDESSGRNDDDLDDGIGTYSRAATDAIEIFES